MNLSSKNNSLDNDQTVKDCVSKLQTTYAEVYKDIGEPATMAEQAIALGLKGEPLAAFVETQILRGVKG